MMVKLIKTALLTSSLLGLTAGVHAQMVQDPTSWTYEVKKKAGNQYELVFHLKLKPGWHVWALKPGGDGYQIAPSFSFDNNSQIKLVGSPKEIGKPVTTRMEGVDGAVTYLTQNVDYVQTIEVKSKTRITGKHEYQVCNDQMCLPPKNKNFVFEVK